jgi:signal transduction histidine kinase
MNQPSAISRWLRSAHTRFIALLVLIELLLAAAILAVTAQQIYDDLNLRDQTQVMQLRDDLVELAEEGGPEMLRHAIVSRASELHARGDAVLLADHLGHVIAGNLNQWPRALPASSPMRVLDLKRTKDQAVQPFIIVTQAITTDRKLLVGRALEGSDALRASLSEALLTALGASLPLAIVGAWLAMIVIDSRIDRINRTAARVTSGQIGARVPLDGSGDRFDRLAGNVNSMLERIEALVGELRSLSDTLAHDLRSPITRLRARIDRARVDHDGDTVPAEVLAAVSREADLLLSMLNSVLAISRAEAGLGKEHMEQVDIGGMIEDLAELYAPLAEEQERNVRAEIISPAVILVHRDLIGQALANLIDNALKHGTGDLVLRLTREGTAGIQLAVWDGGPGISEADQAQALSRFGRLDAARSTPGAGLGLSLVSALAHLHGGSVSFAQDAGRFAVVLNLPARRA